MKLIWTLTIALVLTGIVGAAAVGMTSPAYAQTYATNGVTDCASVIDGGCF